MEIKTMKAFKKLLFALAVLLFVTTSCEKENNDDLNDEKSNTELPANEDEAFDLVTKKWDLTTSEEYNSVELTNDTLYIIDKATVLKSTNSDSEIITGKFEISEDGKTITLIGFGTMTIKQVSDNMIVITIVLDNGTSLGDITGEEQAVVATSVKTEKLCKNWTTNITGCYELGLVFTTSGTVLFDQGTDCEFVTTYNYMWEWSDNTETVIDFKENGETKYSFPISELTETTLTLVVDDGGETITYHEATTSEYVDNSGNGGEVDMETLLIGLWRFSNAGYDYELNFYLDNHVTFFTGESGNTYDIGTWSLDGNSVTITNNDGSETGTINSDNTLTIAIGGLGSRTYSKVE
jgi:hypothetical protein